MKYKEIKIKSITPAKNEDVYDISVLSNHNFFANNILVHNCGEIGTTSVCNLGSLNLTQFLIKPKQYNYYYFDSIEFSRCVELGVRFLDNVNNIGNPAIPDYNKQIKEFRNIGLGITGLGSALMMLEMEYGSNDAQKFVEDMMYLKHYTEIKTSALLGKEKGSFTKFNKNKYFNTPWWTQNPLNDTNKKEIEKIGKMRTANFSTIAPSGNCVRKNTKIKTNEGIKTIKEIFDENRINVSRDEKNKWFIPIKTIYVDTLKGLKRITGLFINNNNTVLSIKTENNKKIEGTEDHKVLVKIDDKKAEWKKLKNLKVGDKILTKNNCS